MNFWVRIVTKDAFLCADNLVSKVVFLVWRNDDSETIGFSIILPRVLPLVTLPLFI